MVMSLNLHGVFKFKEVQHQLNIHPPRVRYTGYMTDFKGKIMNTSVPEDVVLSITKSAIHGFSHDGTHFRVCYWGEDCLDVFKKIEIVQEMISWLHNHKPTDHFIHNFEDDKIFQLAKDSLLAAEINYMELGMPGISPHDIQLDE